MNVETLQIAHLDVKTGDTVVVKINQPLTQGNAEHARQYVQAQLPEGVKLLILDADADISILAQTKHQTGKRR